ncbi:MAG: hypothetical protein J6B34_01035 [Clostridia bacterium]|nr:hypothetical protein [Clostridia bacterium]
MIIDQKKTALSYRCPSCGALPTSIITAFSLSGNHFKLKCSCGKSELNIEKLPDEKIRLTVPCVACPSPHIHTLSQSVFFSDLFIIPCSLCAIDLCFMGREDKVASAIDHSNKEILMALGNNPMEALGGMKGEREETLTDPQISEVVAYVISELHDEGKIYCKCPDNDGEYECTMYNDYIMVKCKKCKASTTVPTDSTIAAHDFLSADSLTLS